MINAARLRRHSRPQGRAGANLLRRVECLSQPLHGQPGPYRVNQAFRTASLPTNTVPMSRAKPPVLNINSRNRSSGQRECATTNWITLSCILSKYSYVCGTPDHQTG